MSAENESAQRGAGDEARAYAVLDGNLRQLLRHAYVPARPAPAFRAQLLLAMRAEAWRHAALRGSTPGPALWSASSRGSTARGKRALAAAAVLAAALLFTVLGVARWNRNRSPRFYPTYEAVLAEGAVAARWDAARGWRAIVPPPGGEAIALGTGRSLELRTPEAIRLIGSLRLSTEGEHPQRDAERERQEQIVLARSSHAVLSCDASRAPRTTALALLAGSLEIRPSTQRLHLRTREGELGLELDGRLRIAALEDRVVLTALEGRVVLPPLPKSASVTLTAGASAFWTSGSIRLADGAVAVGPVASDAREPLTVDSDQAEANVATATDGPLSVVVTARETGLPLERVTLYLVPERKRNAIERTHRRTVASTDGVFDFPEAPEGKRFRLAVHAEGHALWQGELFTLDPSQPRRFEVALERGGTLTGWVVDQESGNAVAGAVVLSERDVPMSGLPYVLADALDEQEIHLPTRATTAADGSFRLEHVSIGAHGLHVSAEGYAPLFCAPVEVRPEDADTGVVAGTLALEREAVLAGGVTAADGSPAAGIRIVVSPLMAEPKREHVLFALAESDRDGAYRVGGLPAAPLLAILLPDPEGRLPVVVRAFEARCGETTRLDFALEPAGTRVAGRLVDPDGAPLPHRNIALTSQETFDFADPDAFRASTSLADGRFQFDGVGPGRYGFVAIGAASSVVVLDELEVLPSDTLEREVRMADTHVVGRAERASDGAPLVNALVVVLRFDPERSELAFSGEVRTDAEGRWRLRGVLPGRSLAVVHPDPAQTRLADVLGHARGPYFEVVPDGTTSDAGTLALGPGGSATVLALDADGRPLANAFVHVEDASGTEMSTDSSPRTDAEGRLRFVGLAPGTYTARLQHDHAGIGTSAFSVRAGEDSSVRVMALEETPAGESAGDDHPEPAADGH